MAINPDSLRCKSLTPADFETLSLIQPILEEDGVVKEERFYSRTRSFSAVESPSQKAEALKKFFSNDYIRVEHLTVEIAGEYIGFSAFFLGLISSSPFLIAKITRVSEEDALITQIMKKEFFQSFVRPCMMCHGRQLNQTRRCRILAQTFSPLINYFYDFSARSHRLTQKTLEEKKRPVKLPFAFQTPEEIPQGTSQDDITRFFAFREASINLRASEWGCSLPTCIEYFENFLARMDQTMASIQNDLGVVFFEHKKADEEIQLYLTDEFFELIVDRQIHTAKPPRFLMFIRDRKWQVDDDHYFVPSFNIVAKTEAEIVKYTLKSVTYVTDPSLMDYATLMIQPSGQAYKWSRESKTPGWEGNMKTAIEEIGALAQNRQLSEEDMRRLRIDDGLVENLDCCIYELLQDF